MVASLTPLTRRAALGLALLPALRRPAVAADLKDIVSTPSGLRYVDFAPGSGAPPRFGQLVRFHYVGYTATEDEKEEIRELIRQQCAHYRREQDKKAQMTKQTRELDRLPSWPPNSPDLNLIEIVWSWMVKSIRDSDDGWPSNPELLKQRVVEAWDAIPLESFRELVRSYRFRLMAIHSANGDRHPQFA